MIDLYNTFKVTTLTNAAVITADTNSSSVDLLGYDSCLVVVDVGLDAGSGLDGSNNWKIGLEESDDDSTFTDVAEANMVGAISGTTTGQFALVDAVGEDETTYKVCYIGSKRYLRVHLDETGTCSTPISAVAIAGNYKYPPVA